MAADRNAVIAMGQEEFVRRWNMGSSEKKALAELFGFASVASLGNVVNHRPPNGLGWIPGGEPKVDGETNKPSKAVNPSEVNANSNLVDRRVSSVFDRLRIINRDVPDLFNKSVDGIHPNPEFVEWFSNQSEVIQSAMQGDVPDSVWDSSMFLIGIETTRRVAALAAQREKERAALEQAKAIMVSAGYIAIHRDQFYAMVQDRAMSLLAPSTADIFAMLSNVFPVVSEPALSAYEGTGRYQYDAIGNLDSRATFSDLLPKADRGCPHVLFYRFKIGEGTKAEQASELKRAKVEQSRHAAETDPTILADWKVYHTAYQDRIDAERALEAAKAAKAAKLAALLEMDDSDLEAFLAAKKAKAA